LAHSEQPVVLSSLSIGFREEQQAAVQEQAIEEEPALVEDAPVDQHDASRSSSQISEILVLFEDDVA